MLLSQHFLPIIDQGNLRELGDRQQQQLWHQQSIQSNYLNDFLMLSDNPNFIEDFDEIKNNEPDNNKRQLQQSKQQMLKNNKDTSGMVAPIKSNEKHTKQKNQKAKVDVKKNQIIADT